MRDQGHCTSKHKVGSLTQKLSCGTNNDKGAKSLEEFPLLQKHFQRRLWEDESSRLGASWSIRPLKIAMFCNPGLHFPVAHGVSCAPPSCSDDKEEDTLVENHKGIACTPSSLCVPVTCLHLIWFDVLKPSRERGNLKRQKLSGSLGR